MATRRVFIAIDVGDEIRRTAAAYSKGLRDEFPHPKVRWERPEKYHITLRFEPEADEAMMEELRRLMREVASVTKPGAFVPRRGNAVLWLGTDATVGEVEEIAAKLLPSNKREQPFHAHITIARTRDAASARELIDRHCATEPVRASHRVNEIVLIKSFLSRSGSTYRVIGREPLLG